jgi:mono/diheme cytochrome c family protein
MNYQLPITGVSAQATNFQRIIQAEKRISVAPDPLSRSGFLSAGNSDRAEQLLANCILRCGLILGVFFLSACSLAEDITPPPGLELTQTAIAPTPAVPAARPDPSAGADIFAQNCIKCHGPTGKGDGELVAQLTGRPPDFADPATLRARAPHEIFTIVTQGRLEKTMPPFGNALTDQQRWDVTAFLFTLAESPAASAEATFAAQCAECHGGGGAPDLSALKFFATRTEQDVFDAITSGLPDGSHTFTTLNEAERWGLANYVRALAFAPVAVAQPEATPAPSAVITGGVTVGGDIINGTSGVAAPDDLVVEAYVFDSGSVVDIYTAAVNGGRYSLTGVDLQAGQAVVAVMNYQGVTYASEIARMTEGATKFDLPIEIFEATTDPTAIRIARWHVVLAAPQAGVMQVAELLVFSNEGDRAVVASSEGLPVLDIPLPEGASNLQFEQNSELYLPTASGFGYAGAVRPGAETLQIIFAFDVPLIRRTDFVQLTRYPVDAVNLLVPQTGVRVTARDLSGPQTTDVQGAPYLAYNGAHLAANDSLSMTLAPASGLSDWSVWIVAGLLIVAATGIGVWWSRRSRRRPAPVTVSVDAAQRRAALIDSLARLDDDFERGQLAERDYRQRRAKLKAEALKLLEHLDE